MPSRKGIAKILTQSSNSPFVIRTARPSDASAIIPVVNAAFAVEKFIEGTRTDSERLTEMLGTGEFLVAEVPAGTGARCIAAAVYVEVKGARGYFGMLSVDPAQQGRGLGRIMVESAEDYLRKRGCLEVKITVVNLRTELPPFYRKLGYVETGTEEFRPSRPLKSGFQAHCIVMTKALQPPS